MNKPVTVNLDADAEHADWLHRKRSERAVKLFSYVVDCVTEPRA